MKLIMYSYDCVCSLYCKGLTNLSSNIIPAHKKFQYIIQQKIIEICTQASETYVIQNSEF